MTVRLRRVRYERSLGNLRHELNETRALEGFLFYELFPD